MEREDDHWALAVTSRCLQEDLGFGPEDVARPIDELAQQRQIVQDFHRQRSQLPIGQETIQGLTTRIVAYSLHSGPDRAVTWHDRNLGLVWLLAAAFHRSGKADDAYPYFVRLDLEGRLLPTEDDFLRFTSLQARDIATSLLADVPDMIAAAKNTPERILSGVVGGRIGVRLVYEADDPPMLTVAISQRLWPGQMQMPADWLIRVAAAFLPNTPAEELSYAWDLGGHELLADEVAFCDFAR